MTRAMNRTTWICGTRDENGLGRLAELIALDLQPGDVIRLEGDLGTGKTTFARAFIRAVLADPEAEIASPTFPIVLTYDAPRVTVAHFDTYRLAEPEEAIEIGLEDHLTQHVSMIEWPDRVDPLLPSDRLTVALTEIQDRPDLRHVTLTGIGPRWAARTHRLWELSDFLHASGHGRSTVTFLQGDASPRKYARLGYVPPGSLPLDTRGRRSAHPTASSAANHLDDDGSVGFILMDAPPQPDGPPIKEGKSYSALAGLAENIRPFVAISGALNDMGLAAPHVHAMDLERGLLLIEDLGDTVFGDQVRDGADVETIWRPALDVLVTLAANPPADSLALPDGSQHALPQFSEDILQIEASLLLNWYVPYLAEQHESTESDAAHVAPQARADYARIWSELAPDTLGADWLLRDFHSPNLLSLSDSLPPADVGVIDFQDALRGHAAYDLVSLLQDARVDVPDAVEAELKEAYLTLRAAAGHPVADESAFWTAYAVLGAQRACKILGIFTRLAVRDGKPGYLQHLPRVRAQLEKNLRHPRLAALRNWMAEQLPNAPVAGPEAGRLADDNQPVGITTAMVLCAGFGTRMRPLTDNRPKPLVHFLGRPLLDHVCDRLHEAGFRNVVLNAHYLADQIKSYPERAPSARGMKPLHFSVSDESAEILDTGGGIAKAISLLGEEPFIVHNADAIWFDAANANPGTLDVLRAAWNADTMDSLLLLVPHAEAFGFDGAGDFFMDNLGTLSRRGGAESAPYVFAGVSIIKPELFADAPSGAFSLNQIWDRALGEGRLKGVVHTGTWFHIGDPQSLSSAEAYCERSGC